MGILDEDIERVRNDTDMVAIVSEHVQLRRVGRRWSGLCPFHGEKSPSFSVNAEEGLYYCFGCHASGDAISFVREIEHLDFVGAVEKLASKAGVILRYTDKNEGEGRKQRARLLGAVEAAVAFYHARLLDGADAGPARAYLRSRGFDADEVRRYRVGWAPDEWDELARSLRLPTDEFIDAGLGFRNSRGKVTDFFRGRLLFPIFDAQGSAVGFGGRILPGGQGPKYKNSADSRIYNKSRLLYGLNWAKGAIVEADEVVVCEGYTDVIGFAAAGVPRAVATCGTALTDEHVKLLRSFARRVVLAFDADAAGQNAAERFYEWERTHDLDVAVAALPAGVDPGDLAREDPAALAAAVADAVPFLGFRVNRVLERLPLATAEQRARAAEEAVAVIAEHPNVLVRDPYFMDVAARTRIDVERIRELSRSPQRRSAGDEEARRRGHRRGREVREAEYGDGGRRTVSVTLHHGPEAEALRLLITDPDAMLPWLHECLFGDQLLREAYLALVAHGSARTAISWADTADEEVAEVLRQAAAAESEAPADDVVGRIVEEASRRVLREIEAEARVAADPLSYNTVMVWLKQELELRLADDAGFDVVERLLVWLIDQSEVQA